MKKKGNSLNIAYISYADYGGPKIHTKEFVRAFRKYVPNLVIHCPYIDIETTFVKPVEKISFFNRLFNHFPDSFKQLKLEFYQIRKLLRDFLKIVEFVRIYKLSRIDLVIVRHDAYLAGALSAAKWQSIPIILEINGILSKDKPDRVTKIYERYCWSKAAGMFTVCEPLQQIMLSRGIRKSKVKVITNGVRLDEFMNANPNRLPKAITKKCRNKIVVGYTGTFTNYHDLENLLKGFAISVSEEIRLQLLLIGEGRNSDIISNLVDKYDLNERVLFTGQVSHAMVPDYLSICRILVLPLKSIYDKIFHGAPVKLFEYMAAGKPIIATRLPSIEKILGEQAIYVSPGSASEWAQSLTLLSSSNEKYCQIGKMARSRLIKKDYTWDGNARRVYEFCEEVITEV
jgi:glycosyltransferase involved in cell wall biosynthesis